MEVIILAAGNGKRMGDVTVPKALYPINGVPNVVNTLSRLSDTILDEVTNVFVVCSEQREADFISQVKNTTLSDKLVIIPIPSGLGDGHAVMQVLFELKESVDMTNDCILVWGDAYIPPNEGRIFTELTETGKQLSRLVIPVKPRHQPYVSILTTENMAAVSADFSKLGENHAHGLHDQSMFMFNKTSMHGVLLMMHNCFWKNGRYITDTGELTFLYVVHALYNLGLSAQAYHTDYQVHSFNTPAEAKAIEKLV